jgi:hypothetical protein
MIKFFKWQKKKDYFLNRCHSWIGHIIRHNESIVNILEGAISGKKGLGNTSTTVPKASHQINRR